MATYFCNFHGLSCPRTLHMCSLLIWAYFPLSMCQKWHEASPFLSLSFSPSACLLITVTLFSIWMELGRTERDPYRAYTEWKERSQMKAYGLCMRRCEIGAGGLTRLRSYSGRHRSYSRWVNTRGSILCVKFPRVMSFIRMNQARAFQRNEKELQARRDTYGLKYGPRMKFWPRPFSQFGAQHFLGRERRKKSHNTCISRPHHLAHPTLFFRYDHLIRTIITLTIIQRW